MATFWANEINSTGGDITGQKAYVQILFPLKEKNAGFFNTFFPRHR